jgi:hypothetical protein
MIISPVPPHALWKAFRVRKEDIPHEKARIEKAIARIQQITAHAPYTTPRDPDRCG